MHAINICTYTFLAFTLLGTKTHTLYLHTGHWFLSNDTGSAVRLGGRNRKSETEEKCDSNDGISFDICWSPLTTPAHSLYTASGLDITPGHIQGLRQYYCILQHKHVCVEECVCMWLAFKFLRANVFDNQYINTNTYKSKTDTIPKPLRSSTSNKYSTIALPQPKIKHATHLLHPAVTGAGKGYSVAVIVIRRHWRHPIIFVQE